MNTPMTHEQGNTQVPSDEIIKIGADAIIDDVIVHRISLENVREMKRRIAKAVILATQATLLSQVRQKEEALRAANGWMACVEEALRKGDEWKSDRAKIEAALSPAPQPGADAKPTTRNEVDRLATDRPNSQFDSGDRGQAPQPDAAPADQRFLSQAEQEVFDNALRASVKDVSPLPADDVIEAAKAEAALRYPRPFDGSVYSEEELQQASAASGERSGFIEGAKYAANLLRQSAPVEASDVAESIMSLIEERLCIIWSPRKNRDEFKNLLLRELPAPPADAAGGEK